MLINKRQSIALAIAVLLAGCGGGGAQAPAESTPQAAAGAMRAHAMAVSAAAAGPVSSVTADEAARQLMNYAQTAYRKFFPEIQPTQSFGPFKYRAYSSGVLLGVVVSADPSYVLNGVYVMGGSFGNTPLHVGQLSDFITPVVPGPGPIGTHNGCFNLDLASSSGNETSVSYEHSGPVTGTTTVVTGVNGFATFEGQQLIETLVRTSGVLFENGLPASASFAIKNYHRKTGDAELTHFGSSTAKTVTTTDYIATTTETTVFSPPWVDRVAALAFEESLSSARTSTTTRVTTYSIPGFPPNTSSFNTSVTEYVRYMGREVLSLPAGDYATCKFERSAGDTVTSEWVLVANGLLLQSVKVTGTTTQTMKAKSVMLNGNPT